MLSLTESLDITQLCQQPLDKLHDMNKECVNTKRELEQDRNKQMRIIRLIDNQLKIVNDNFKLVSKQIEFRQELEDSKNMIDENIANIENFDLLNEEELMIITSKMDKTDYRKQGDYPRWLDLESIIKYVIDMKKKYTKWTLTDLSKGGQYDTLPPKTFYTYEFKDENEQYFDIGGIKLLSK